MTLADNINVDTASFLDRRELACAKTALESLNNVVALKNSSGLPLSHDTHTAVEQLEQEIFCLRWSLLEPQSPQNSQKTAPEGF